MKPEELCREGGMMAVVHVEREVARGRREGVARGGREFRDADFSSYSSIHTGIVIGIFL
jgi:hypothetical protein